MHRYLRKLTTKLSGNLKLTEKCLNMNKESALLKVNTIMLMMMKRLTMAETTMNWLTIVTTMSKLMKRLLILVLKIISLKVIANLKLMKSKMENLKIKPKLSKRALAQRIS